MQIPLRHTIRLQSGQIVHHYRVLLADLFLLPQIQASRAAFGAGFLGTNGLVGRTPYQKQQQMHLTHLVGQQSQP